jgi:thioredoxin reductase
MASYKEIFQSYPQQQMSDIDTAIVGAGPYGLSLAAHLKSAKLSHEIFGTPLESWRNFMPEGMFLKSEPFASNLWDPDRRYTFERYANDHGLPYQRVGKPVGLALFLRYAEWFRQQAVGDIRDIRVARISQAGSGFVLDLSDGSKLTSRRVVLATGHMAFAVLPPELTHMTSHRICHSSRMGEVASYAGRDVTLIGAGQSALEIGALLHEAGARVRILARQSQINWNEPSTHRPFLSRLISPDAGVASGWRSVAVSEFPRTFRWRYPAAKRHRFVSGSYGPSGSWWLRDRLVGKAEVHTSCLLQRAVDENIQVALRVSKPSGSSEILTDYVIAATGFKVNIDKLQYLEPEVRQKIAREAAGIPELSSCFETSVPNLFIVGVASAPVFGPIMRFMYGAKHVGRVLARRLSSRT